MQTRFEHVCHCSEDILWRQLAFDPEFNRRLFIEVLDFESFEVESFDETAAEIRRVVVGTPKISRYVPRASRRLFNRGLRFRETDVFDKRNRCCTSTIVPTAYSHGLTIKVECSTQPLGLNHCRCIFAVTITASIFTKLGGNSAFGISGVIENEVAKHLASGFEARTAFTNRYVAEKGLGAPFPSTA